MDATACVVRTIERSSKDIVADGTRPASATAATPEFLSKKHVIFDQGLDFLIFCQGNRGKNKEKRGKKQEHIRKCEEHLENPGPYFLFNIFL